MKPPARSALRLLILAAASTSLSLACSEKQTQPLEMDPPFAMRGALRTPVTQGVEVLFNDTRVEPRAFAKEVIAAHGGTLRHVFEHGTKGFSAMLPNAAVDALRQNPRVKFVTPIQVVVALDHGFQSGAPWGLDRIDQRPPTAGGGTYQYGETGAGVTAYVFGTGIRTAHAEFGGRAAVAYDFAGGNGQDCNGHETHVAGIMGGSTYGVAKQVQLRAVRILDCAASGLTDWWMAAIDAVIANHATPAVANMSVGIFDGQTGMETTHDGVDTKLADFDRSGRLRNRE